MQKHQQEQPESTNNLRSFFIGQEFIDALPVYSFEKTSDGVWRERMVDVVAKDDDIDDGTNGNDSESCKNAIQLKGKNDLEKRIKKPRLRIVLAPEVTPSLKTLLQTDDDGYLLNKDLDAAAVPGNIIEVCPEGILIVKDIATIIEQTSGAALFIDYGQLGSTDSIRAYTNHEQVHFLSRPGLVDVTADVDFAALKYAVNNNATGRRNAIEEENRDESDPQQKKTSTNIVQAFGPITQGNFLMSMGMQERVISLVEKNDTTDEMAENVYDAMVQLASPDHMGERYKVLALVSATSSNTTTKGATNDQVSAPPGF
jgi:NADH dehydrogenase [ubiquinone] 1 alpha subcomplex assembly factor 7